MTERFEIVRWSDDAIGQGFELYAHGEYVGTSGSIRLLRKWARDFWRGIKNAPTSA